MHADDYAFGYDDVPIVSNIPIKRFALQMYHMAATLAERARAAASPTPLAAAVPAVPAMPGVQGHPLPEDAYLSDDSKPNDDHEEDDAASAADDDDNDFTYGYDPVIAQLQPAVDALTDKLSRVMSTPKVHSVGPAEADAASFDVGDCSPAEPIEDDVMKGATSLLTDDTGGTLTSFSDALQLAVRRQQVRCHDTRKCCHMSSMCIQLFGCQSRGPQHNIPALRRLYLRRGAGVLRALSGLIRGSCHHSARTGPGGTWPRRRPQHWPRSRRPRGGVMYYVQTPFSPCAATPRTSSS